MNYPLVKLMSEIGAAGVAASAPRLHRGRWGRPLRPPPAPGLSGTTRREEEGGAGAARSSAVVPRGLGRFSLLCTTGNPRDGSRAIGSTPAQTRNRTAHMALSPYPTVYGLSGDVARSTDPLLEAGFLYRTVYGFTGYRVSDFASCILYYGTSEMMQEIM